jgi:hypothetical protein
MTFTTSDKKEQTEKFVKIEDISFLKRTFRYHTLLKRIVAPLDKDSIMKSYVTTYHLKKFHLKIK